MADGIVAALVAFQADLPKVGKSSTASVETKTGRTFQYGYADLSDVSAIVLPALAKHGIAYTTSLNRIEGGLVLRADLRHTSGETIGCEWPIQLGTPQAMGSAITYGRRYCLLAMTGVHPSGEDDDAATVETVEQPHRAPRIPARSDSDPDKITPAQVKKLWTQMRHADMGNDDVARTWMASILGMPADDVHTPELTREQADLLFAELKLLAGRKADRTRPTEPPPPDQWTTVDETTGEVLMKVEP